MKTKRVWVKERGRKQLTIINRGELQSTKSCPPEVSSSPQQAFFLLVWFWKLLRPLFLYVCICIYFCVCLYLCACVCIYVIYMLEMRLQVIILASQMLYHWAVPLALRCNTTVLFNVPQILNFGTILFSLFQRLDLKSKDISKIAADITQAISLSQGIERKKVIQHIRGMYKIDLSASRHWQELIQQLTHDRCVLGTHLVQLLNDVKYCFHYRIQMC